MGNGTNRWLKILLLPGKVLKFWLLHLLTTQKYICQSWKGRSSGSQIFYHSSRAEKLHLWRIKTVGFLNFVGSRFVEASIHGFFHFLGLRSRHSRKWISCVRAPSRPSAPLYCRLSFYGIFIKVRCDLPLVYIAFHRGRGSSRLALTTKNCSFSVAGTQVSLLDLQKITLNSISLS